MTQWTNSARKTLEDYLAQVSGSLARTGVDAAEVTEDLRRHLDEEIAAAKLSVVTEEDLRRILARVGPPEFGVAPVSEPLPGEQTPETDERLLKKGSKWLLFFGVILPAVTLGIELATHMCAGC